MSTLTRRLARAAQRLHPADGHQFEVWRHADGDTDSFERDGVTLTRQELTQHLVRRRANTRGTVQAIIIYRDGADVPKGATVTLPDNGRDEL